MNERRFLTALLILAVGGAPLASTLGFLYLRLHESTHVTALNQRPDFVEPGSVPIGGPFTLVDHTGKTVADADFRDKCLHVLGKDARAVQPLFIGVDPDRDTPKRLAEYVKAFHPRIVGLTGSLEQIGRSTKAYRTLLKISAQMRITAGRPMKNTGRPIMATIT